MQVLIRAYYPQELQGLAVAAKEHVLPVVDRLVAARVDEAAGASAHRGARLEDADTRAGLGQGDGCTQAREASSEDRNVSSGHS